MVIKPQVVSQEALSLAETREILKKLEKDKGTLNYRAGKVNEFIKSVKIIPKKDAEELFAKLMKAELPRLKEMHLKKIIDLMPHSEQELDIIFYGGTVSLSKESKKKILELLEPYYEKLK